MPITSITSGSMDFVFGKYSPSGKTEIWNVFSKNSPQLLGEVKWWSRWRRYTFFPVNEMLFDASCLRDIADLCESRTKVKGREAGGRETQRKEDSKDSIR